MKRMPEYLRAVGKAFGKLGGQTSARNLTAAERSARAKIASIAAAKVRTEKRLAAAGKARAKNASKK